MFWNKLWKYVIIFIWSFIEGLFEKIIGVIESWDEWVVFIDINFFFVVYMEIVFVVVNKLIILINVDDFCKEVLWVMLDLVYGIILEEELEDFLIYWGYMFSNKVWKYDFKLFEIYLLINNRIIIINICFVKVFNVMGEENFKVFFDVY